GGAGQPAREDMGHHDRRLGVEPLLAGALGDPGVPEPLAPLQVDGLVVGPALPGRRPEGLPNGRAREGQGEEGGPHRRGFYRSLARSRAQGEGARGPAVRYRVSRPPRPGPPPGGSLRGALPMPPSRLRPRSGVRFREHLGGRESRLGDRGRPPLRKTGALRAAAVAAVALLLAPPAARAQYFGQNKV